MHSSKAQPERTAPTRDLITDLTQTQRQCGKQYSDNVTTTNVQKLELSQYTIQSLSREVL